MVVDWLVSCYKSLQIVTMVSDDQLEVCSLFHQSGTDSKGSGKLQYAQSVFFSS